MIDGKVARMEAALARLREQPLIGAGEKGAPDPETGERWDRMNVLGHVAEMLAYWPPNLTGGLKGRTLGRDEEGYATRQAAIDGAHQMPEADLRRLIDERGEVAVRFVAGLQASDLERQVRHWKRGTVVFGQVLEEFLVGHLEEHVDQLAQDPAEGPAAP